MNTTTDKIIPLLERFGVSSQEASLYLTTLSLEKPTVSELARKSPLSRTVVYFHVKNMLKRGLLKESRKNTKIQLIPTPPDELGALFERWTLDFKAVIPQMNALGAIDQETPRIKITESHQGYMEIYDALSSMPEGSPFRVLEGKNGMAHELPLLTDAEWNVFFSRIVARKIHTKGLFIEEALSIPQRVFPQNLMNLIRKRTWDNKTLPQSIVPFDELMLIYGNTIAFLFPETKLVMTIEHKAIVKALTAMFDGLHAFGKPFTW